MSSSDGLELLEFFKLERWFQVVTLLGVALLIIAITLPTQILTNELIGIFGVGLIALGIGSWKNNKSFAQVRGHFIASGEDRIPDAIGMILEIIGVLILAYGVVTLLL